MKLESLKLLKVEVISLSEDILPNYLNSKDYIDDTTTRYVKATCSIVNKNGITEELIFLLPQNSKNKQFRQFYVNSFSETSVLAFIKKGKMVRNQEIPYTRNFDKLSETSEAERLKLQSSWGNLPYNRVLNSTVSLVDNCGVTLFYNANDMNDLSILFNRIISCWYYNKNIQIYTLVRKDLTNFISLIPDGENVSYVEIPNKNVNSGNTQYMVSTSISESTHNHLCEVYSKIKDKAEKL